MINQILISYYEFIVTRLSDKINIPIGIAQIWSYCNRRNIIIFVVGDSLCDVELGEKLGIKIFV